MRQATCLLDRERRANSDGEIFELAPAATVDRTTTVTNTDPPVPPT